MSNDPRLEGASEALEVERRPYASPEIVSLSSDVMVNVLSTACTANDVEAEEEGCEVSG